MRKHKKKDGNVVKSWDRREACGVLNEFPTDSSTLGFQLGVAQRLLSWWFDSLAGGTMTSLPVWELLWTTKHATCSQYILHMCIGQRFVFCPRIISFMSFRETDLYFPAHWPGYYYKWEGNNIGWTAGSACNLQHICPFHGCLWSRVWVRSSPLSRQHTRLSIFRLVCLSGYRISFFTKSIDDFTRSAS